MTSAAPTVLAIETDSAWAVILAVSGVTLVAALLLRKLIGRPGGLASGVLLSLPLALPLVAAVAYGHAVLPEISVWQPIDHALRGAPGELLHLLLVADEGTGSVTPYASTGSAGRWLFIVGVTVSSVMFVRRLVGSALIYRVIARSRPIDGPRADEVNALMTRLAADAGLTRVPDFLVAPKGVTGAFALGVRRQRILLSQDVLAALEPDELEATLAHEMAHLEARDVPVMFGAGLLRDLVAWNPLGHVAYRRLMKDRELEADRRAATMTKKPLAVASGLLKVCELMQNGRGRHRFALGFLTERGGMSRRVTTLLDAADGRLSLASGGNLPYVFAAVLVATLGLQVGARVAQETPAVVITWDGPEAAGKTWSPDEFRALRGEPPRIPAPRKKEIHKVKPAHYFPPVGAAAVRLKDVPEWFAAMDRWTARQRKEFVRMRWESRHNWEATRLAQFSMGPFDIYRVEPYPF